MCPALVTYLIGWNLIAVTPDTALVGSREPLYTFQAGDATYEAISAIGPLRSGRGYWAYFDQNTPESLPQNTTQSLTLTLPAAQFVMIGNPFGLTATVIGADAVEIYTTSNGVDHGYLETTELAPGQGAWAYSAGGGVVTVSIRGNVN